MGNFSSGLKRFFANKNTVTILGVIVGVIVIWGFYNYRVKKATNPVTVPYAKQEITATTEITSDMIGYTEVNSKFLKTASVYQSNSGLIGKYVTTGTSIPAGGLFYKAQVVEKDDLPNSIFDNIPACYTIYSLGVTNHSTYANSIYPGTRIDLYMKAKDDTGKIMYGKIIQSIEVLAVRDSSGKNVFDQNPNTTPAELLFAVPNEMYTFLMRAGYLTDVTILPVPRNKAYTEEAGSTEYSSDILKNYVLAKTATIADETSNTSDCTTGSSTSTNTGSTTTNQ
jgi:Flp pilus assembly protein CpaB